MPLWIILVVAGIVIVAALVLIVAVHILDVHAEQQCAHLHNLTRRSLEQNQDHNKLQYRCGDSQHCCMCGSVRNRRSHAGNGNNSSPPAKINPKLSTAGGLLQPLIDAACGRSSLGSGSFDCLSGLTSRRKEVASGLQAGWFNRRGFFRGNGAPEETPAKVRMEDNQGAVAAEAAADSETPVVSSSAAAFASTSQLIAGSDSDSTTTFTITTTSDSPNSLTSDARTSSPGVGSNEGGTWKPVPQRRFVLEILMSPSTTSDGQGGVRPRATGVRLKFETSSDEENGFLAQETDPIVVAQALTAAGLTTASCSPIPVDETSAANLSNFVGDNDGTTRVSGLSSIEGLAQPDISPLLTRAAGKCDLESQEGTAACMSSMADKASTVGIENDSGSFHTGNSSGLSICLSPLDKRTGDLEVPTTVTSNLLTPAACKARPNGLTPCANPSSKAKAKVASCSSNSNSSTVAVLPAGEPSSCSSALPLKCSQNQASFSSSLDGLGSLRIRILDGSAKGKPIKECPKGVTAQIASALAALNVDSVGGKCVGMILTGGQGGDAVQEEELPGDGSGSEQVVEEGDEHHPAPEAAEEDECDVNKKEKRKKKNRGRRHKAKAAAVAAAAAGTEAQDQHMNRRHNIEALETPNHAVESEIGCICGIPKGACHSIACPYPFTSSGSMVQRKIKEQYDELVRSNVARTLTLAQVGRFTTCLVEAKSTLQQKSDTIQRRFTIAKSLLSKADKSSFDRLCGQIYGLEIEQKKLEEDTVVYNRLQEQLKLSPAYQKMLEYGRTHFELQPNTGQLIEKVDSNDMEISFEELLAQEKKDSFWQKHGPSRTSMQVN